MFVQILNLLHISPAEIKVFCRVVFTVSDIQSTSNQLNKFFFSTVSAVEGSGGGPSKLYKNTYLFTSTVPLRAKKDSPELDIFLIMRDVNYGWLIRYLHANVASFFFIFVYAHIGRGMYYASYKSPRILPWSIGVIIFA